jgi:hypothetical protein
LTPFFDQNLERNNEIRVAHLQVLIRRPTIPSTRWIDQTRSTVRMGPITDRIYQHHKRLDATKEEKRKMENGRCYTQQCTLHHPKIVKDCGEKKQKRRRDFCFISLFWKTKSFFGGYIFFFFPVSILIESDEELIFSHHR